MHVQAREEIEGTIENVDDDISTQTQAAAVAVGVDKTDKRRGSCRRKYYTVDFKVNTLQLLDALSELKTKKKWEKVAEEQGISRSLAVKWNKNKDNLQAEQNLNRRKENREN